MLKEESSHKEIVLSIVQEKDCEKSVKFAK